MLVGPVARVDHAAADPPRVRQPVGCARRVVAYDDGVGTHRLEGERRVLEAFALRHARPFGREVDDVGGQPLGSSFERDAGAGRVLEEQVDHRATAQRGQLLDRPVGQLGELLGGVEHEQRVGVAQVGAGEQVLVHGRDSRICLVDPGTLDGDGVATVDLDQLDPHALAHRRGEVLADVVGSDGQLAVAAVDQDGELDELRPSQVAEGVERGADRATGEQHVVDEHDPAPVDPFRRHVGVLEGAGGSQPQVVAVHRHVQRADRDGAALDVGDAGREPGRQRARPGTGCRAARGRRRPCCARGSRVPPGSGPGRCRLLRAPAGRSGTRVSRL